jgi:hypothetical protein
VPVTGAFSDHSRRTAGPYLHDSEYVPHGVAQITAGTSRLREALPLASATACRESRQVGNAVTVAHQRRLENVGHAHRAGSG